MDLRQQINKRPAAAITAMAGILVVVVAFAILQIRNSRSGPAVSDRAFYTVDDGATLFVDSANRNPPFQHEGREAVLARVFTCDGGKHQWVQYLEKYSDQAKGQLDSPQSQGPPPERPGNTGPMSGLLVKRPGDSAWVPRMDPKAATILRPKCPDGAGAGPLDAVMP